MTRPVYTAPIIFSAPMIRSLIAGQKTQTRRLITSQWANVKMHHDAGQRVLLWVRESVALRDKERDGRTFKQPRYAADDSVVMDGGHPASNHYFLPRLSVPSIHMPRWASRLTLELSDVRVQRLQDISEEECWAEGIGPARRSGETFCDHPVNAYKALWESLHGDGSWEVNPEIIAFTFVVHRQNVDAPIGQQSDG